MIVLTVETPFTSSPIIRTGAGDQRVNTQDRWK